MFLDKVKLKLPGEVIFLEEIVGAPATAEQPLTRPSDTLSPSEGERDGVRGPSEACANSRFMEKMAEGRVRGGFHRDRHR